MNINKKLLFLGGGLIVLLLIVFAITTIHKRPLTAKLTIQVAPKSSVITLNGKKVKASIISVKPGEYKVSASHSGFAEKTQTIKLSKDASQYVGLVLISNATSTANWYSSHPEDQTLVEVITGKTVSNDSEAQQKTIPLIKELPFIDQLFRVDYGVSKLKPTDPSAVAIYIKYYSDAGKQEALDWLKFKGYEPSALEIIYVNAESD